MHSFLKNLLGTWESVEAVGKYPTIKDFSYNEELTFEEKGQPILIYKAITSIGGVTKHCESGFIRANPQTNKAFTNEAHNFGLSVVMEGEISENKMTVESKEIGRLSVAKEPHVTKISKVYDLSNEDTLVITTDMATTSTEMTNHLIVTYKKKNV
ncbi:peroxynitrite isomerase THAP4-like [Chironomus tepperi]|uniref:peroxynitrite isomerase THAP4-like n=1 Tax=Chironomus tepperi TaxID=113505 RepID=UPI00391FA0F8